MSKPTTTPDDYTVDNTEARTLARRADFSPRREMLLAIAKANPSASYGKVADKLADIRGTTRKNPFKSYDAIHSGNVVEVARTYYARDDKTPPNDYDLTIEETGTPLDDLLTDD